MGANTEISWTDHTFNPWEGCTTVSPGCAHCYAETRNARFGGGTAPNWGKGAPRRRTSVHNWNEPRRWDAATEMMRRAIGSGSTPYVGEAYRRPRVFCASLADWLDDEVPVEWLADLLALIRETPNLDWLLLTKRPENFKARLQAVWEREAAPSSFAGWVGNWIFWNKPPANVWVGTTVEDQTRANERIPALLAIPARMRFLSCEPLLSSVNLAPWVKPILGPFDARPAGIDAIHWVIAGGESGAKARPMHPQWARSLRDQCAAAGVAFHFKQWGEWAPAKPASGVGTVCFYELAGPDERIQRVGKKAAGRLLDGVTHDAFPET